MNNPLIAWATTLALVGAATPAMAGHDGAPDGADWEWATVTRAEPVYRRIRVETPRESCVERPVRERTVHHHGRDPGVALVGGLIGGVIGHQFGGGSGKKVATAAGALIGASHAVGRSHHHVVERTVYETHCRTVHDARWETRLDGYEVSYRWRGRAYRTWMDEDPGRRVRVRLEVAPLDGES